MSYTAGDIFADATQQEEHKSVKTQQSKKQDEINIRDDLAESGVVGCVLNSPTMILQSESLKPSMFYNIELGTFYDILYNLVEVDSIDKIDDFTIISRIEGDYAYKSKFSHYSTKQLREFLARLRNVGTPSTEEYLKRCETVLTFDFRRKSNLKLKELANVIENCDKNINELNLYVQDEVMKLSENYLIDSEIKIIKDVIDAAWAEIQDRRDGNTGVGFLSKFKTVNEFFSYEKGELVVLGGRARLWLAI